jgi:hypothetical protein
VGVVEDDRSCSTEEDVPLQLSQGTSLRDKGLITKGDQSIPPLSRWVVLYLSQSALLKFQVTSLYDDYARERESWLQGKVIAQWFAYTIKRDAYVEPAVFLGRFLFPFEEKIELLEQIMREHPDIRSLRFFEEPFRQYESDFFKRNTSNGRRGGVQSLREIIHG